MKTLIPLSLAITFLILCGCKTPEPKPSEPTSILMNGQLDVKVINAPLQKPDAKYVTIEPVAQLDFCVVNPMLLQAVMIENTKFIMTKLSYATDSIEHLETVIKGLTQKISEQEYKLKACTDEKKKLKEDASQNTDIWSDIILTLFLDVTYIYIICGAIIGTSIVVLIMPIIPSFMWNYLKYKNAIYFICKVVMGISLMLLSFKSTTFLYLCHKTELFNGSTLWVLALVFFVGLILLFVDIRKLRSFTAGSVGFELEQVRNETKNALAETYNQQGNLNKHQNMYAEAIRDYSRAAKLYAEKGDWNGMFNMLRTINRYTELSKEREFRVFISNLPHFGYTDECEPWSKEELDRTNNLIKCQKKIEVRGTNYKRELDTQQDIVKKSYIDGKDFLEKALDELRAIPWSDDVEKYLPTLKIDEIEGRLNHTTNNLKTLLENIKTWKKERRSSSEHDSNEQ